MENIESRKDREYDSDRMERLENNQRAQGAEIKVISDLVIRMSESVNSNTNKWIHVGQIIGTVITAVLIGKFV